MLITPTLIGRIEQFHREFNQARTGALRLLAGNPYGAELRTWDGLTAHKFTSPLLRGKNRIGNLTEAALPFLDDALDFYAADDLRPTLSVPYGSMTEAVFRALVAWGYWSGGSGTVPALIPALIPDDSVLPPAPPSLTVRASPLQEQELYLDVFQNAFSERGEAAPDYRRIQQSEDTLPGAHRYLAFWDGEAVGMASLITIGDIGLCGTAGVLPNFRRRGIQQELLAQRIADAPGLGVDLVIGGGSLFSTTHRNFERVGMRLVPLGSGWIKRAD